jgi:hypothetical protein
VWWWCRYIKPMLKKFHPDRHDYETRPTTHGKFLLCGGLRPPPG